MGSNLEKLERINVRLPENVKAWYMSEATSLGMSMSQYMSFILVTHFRNQETMNSMKTLSDLAKDPEVKKSNQEMLEFMKSPEFIEMMKEASQQMLVLKEDKKLLK